MGKDEPVLVFVELSIVKEILFCKETDDYADASVRIWLACFKETRSLLSIPS